MFVTSQEACQLLGVKPATLYTYVSRGLLHPTASSGRKASLYLLEEVKDLRARSEARMGHGAVAASALRWGQPVIDTAITEITPQGPSYRGHLALDLVRRSCLFENVAELLWSGVLPRKRVIWDMPQAPESIPRVLHEWDADKCIATTALSLACMALDAGPLDSARSDDAAASGARQLLCVFAACCGLLGPDRRVRSTAGRQPMAQVLADALGMPDEAGLPAMLNTVLILSADHELSPPTFSARIAASVGSSLHACVVAALAAHAGSGLGGGCDRLESMADEASSPARLRSLVARHVRDRVQPPGFSLASSYPQGDPRAAYLLDLARAHPERSSRTEQLFRLIDALQTQMGVTPSIETGLVAVSATWGLPPRSASMLWAIGRTAGWVAHVQEQRRHGAFLRPRGQFRPDAPPR